MIENARRKYRHACTQSQTIVLGISWPHTVQRALLEKIAVDGHVYGIKKGFAELKKNGGILRPERVGLSKASTFTGFCSLHDKTLFAPVEDTAIVPSPEHAFLLAYRALCHELYAKRFQSTLTESVLKQMDRGRTEPEQVLHQGWTGLYGEAVDVGRRDLEHHKAKYDKLLVAGDFALVKSVFMRLDGMPPLMASGAIFPECSFDGEVLQDLADKDAILDLLSFSLVSTGLNGIAVFAWVGDSKSCDWLTNSLLALPTNDQGPALGRFVFEFLENVYLAPAWWEKTPADQKRKIMDRLMAGVAPFEERSAGCLADDGERSIPLSVHELVDLR